MTLFNLELPDFTLVSQVLSQPEKLENPLEQLHQELNKIKRIEKCWKGLKIGITVGSRGITHLPYMIKEIANFIISMEGEPIIIPSMGSHGGATSKGQLEVLNSLGINENKIGAPISSDLTSTFLGNTSGGTPVYCNSQALQVDRLIVFNRIKPHTDYSGDIESGICKMLAVGLGGFQGALTVHSQSLKNGFAKVIKETADLMLQKINIPLAIGVLEDATGNPIKIKGMFPEEVLLKEPKLLQEVKSYIPGIPFQEIDVLVVGEIGKEISGTGMDTNIIGRSLGSPEEKMNGIPLIKRIAVLGLTESSHGNATGIGLADVTTQKLYNQMCLKATAINCIYSMAPEQGRLPCVLKNDEEAIKAAMLSAGLQDKDKARIVLIKNTSKLETMLISEALLDEAHNHKQINTLDIPQKLQFDNDHNLDISAIFGE